MRKPGTSGALLPPESAPGGHARNRAQQFAQQRGLTATPEFSGAGLPLESEVPPVPCVDDLAVVNPSPPKKRKHRSKQGDA